MPHRPTYPSCRGARGYTLLEIALVVTIIALLVGAAVPLTRGFTREERLREAVRELLVLAKSARTAAMESGRPAAVIFEPQGFAWQRAGDEEPSARYVLPRGMSYDLRPFGSDKPSRPDGQSWIFQPTGLCEPVEVRVMEDAAWMEVRFDPLTAGLAEENYYIP